VTLSPCHPVTPPRKSAFSTGRGPRLHFCTTRRIRQFATLSPPLRVKIFEAQVLVELATQFIQRSKLFVRNFFLSQAD
jgi:hypothetical protein